jgi:riboflavin kinase/FMN adenylyltransferase
VKKAAGMLGRHYDIHGRVTRGNNIGNKLGFPTANILIDDEIKLIPKTGVYSVRVVIERAMYHGMLNIGTRPTLNEKSNQQHIEVHIFDFNKAIYNEAIEIQFVERIRDEQKFENLEQLQQQLQTDKQKIMLSLQ